MENPPNPIPPNPQNYIKFRKIGDILGGFDAKFQQFLPAYANWFSQHHAYLEVVLRDISVPIHTTAGVNPVPRAFVAGDLAWLDSEMTAFIQRVNNYHSLYPHYQFLPGSLPAVSGTGSQATIGPLNPSNASFEHILVAVSLIKLQQSLAMRAQGYFTYSSFSTYAHESARDGIDPTVERLRLAAWNHWSSLSGQVQFGILTDLETLHQYILSLDNSHNRPEVLKSVVNQNLTAFYTHPTAYPAHQCVLAITHIAALLARAVQFGHVPQFSPSRITRRKKSIYFGRA